MYYLHLLRYGLGQRVTQDKAEWTAGQAHQQQWKDDEHGAAVVWFFTYCVPGRIYCNAVMLKRLQSWCSSALDQGGVRLCKQSAPDWCVGSLYGSWCHTGHREGAQGGRVAHPGAGGLSVEVGSGKSLGRCAEGPGGDGGSWGGSLAERWYSE